MKADRSSMPETVTLTLKTSELYEEIDALDKVIEILEYTPKYEYFEKKMRHLHGSLWDAFFEQVVKVINVNLYSGVVIMRNENEVKK